MSKHESFAQDVRNAGPVGWSVLAFSLLCLGLALIGLHGAGAPAPSATMPACATEDSPGPCRWDATVHGNGQGRSFTVDEDGTITYDDDRPLIAG